MDSGTVRLVVPADAGYVALLRTLVSGCAGRDGFTVEQIDDVKLAVEEAAVQLLRASTDDELVCEVERTESGLRALVSAHTEDLAVMDESSFSWMILNALTDEVEIDRAEGRTTVVLAKIRAVAAHEGTA